MSIEFFHDLRDNDDFCTVLGRLTLITNVLEAQLRDHLQSNGHEPRERATFGQLVEMLKKHDCLSHKASICFDEYVNHRNYLTHDLHNLLTGKIPETILAGTNLVEADIDYYIQCVETDLENIGGFVEIIERNRTSGHRSKQLL